jgi:hypothetical protein
MVVLHRMTSVPCIIYLYPARLPGMSIYRRRFEPRKSPERLNGRHKSSGCLNGGNEPSACPPMRVESPGYPIGAKLRPIQDATRVI